MKKCKFFGTDGIRGVVGQDFDTELVTRIANATAAFIQKRPAKVIIGWDTRASCDFIVDILAGTLAYYGIDVVKVGVVPTAALSFLTNKLKANLGIMVSASHCTTKYNGVKFFTDVGEKLSNAQTFEFDKLIVKKTKPTAAGKIIGTSTQDLKAIKLWHKFLANKFKSTIKRDIKVAVDCAKGSGTQCAKEVLKALGVKATFFNDTSTGFDINDGCGATKPVFMNNAMAKKGFDIGFAFDGDADRCIVFDGQGNHIHGDIVIYLLAKYLKNQGKLAKNKVAGTILFNLGMEKELGGQGIKLIRTDVGDAYVYHAMKVEKLSMGGETSGHINFADVWCTGDGLVVALMVMSVIASETKQSSINELVSNVSLFPQININTDATPEQKKQLFKDAGFLAYVKQQQKKHTDFRIIVRPSGTENIVRVTVEGPDTKMCEKIATEIIAQIRKTLVK